MDKEKSNWQKTINVKVITFCLLNSLLISALFKVLRMKKKFSFCPFLWSREGTNEGSRLCPTSFHCLCLWRRNLMMLKGEGGAYWLKWIERRWRHYKKVSFHQVGGFAHVSGDFKCQNAGRHMFATVAN